MVQDLKLSNGRTMPAVGLGTWKSEPGVVAAAVKSAILDAGYRHIDCAHVYQNEPEVGQALAEVFASGKVKREELFITSKCWNSHHSRGKVKELLHQILKDLQLDYLDLYLVHWPMGFKEDAGLFPTDASGKVLYSDVHFTETWKGMEDCYEAGLTKAIGISNFTEKQTDEILAMAKVKPMVNQVEVHPYLNQEALLQYCKSKDIIMTAYSPLGSPDRPWAKPGEPTLLDDPKIVEIAKNHNKSPAQVLIRFAYQRGISVIPKSVTPSRIAQNINIFDFELSKEDMDYIYSLNRDWRACIPPGINDHPLHPFPPKSA